MYNPYNFYARSIDSRLSGEGQLHINVFDTTEGKPVNNANVKITPRGNNSNILDEGITDDSGELRNN